MREARIKTDSPEGPAGAAAPVRRSFVVRLLGGLLDWRRREADRTIGRYVDMIGQPADLYRVYEADIARPEPQSSVDRTDALRRGIVVHDCA